MGGQSMLGMITAVIPSTQEVEVEGWCSEPSQDKSIRPYLKNKLKAKGLAMWLKW
jgi:hypothetical protein